MDIFATIDGRVQLTNLACHEINTGEHQLIKQPPYQLGLHKKEIVRVLVTKMLEDDVTEDSSSTWVSQSSS